ncbi:MAG: hypothetical protein K6G18_12365 [Treponema sp.]|nr:hypothetical protein [Treponema sp.]
MFGIKTKIMRLAAGAAYRSQYAPAKGSPLESLPLYRKFRLDIPTYDGSGQIVHPDIFFDRTIGKYVLAFTPYPHTDDRFENPCIAVSDDGIHFHEEKPGLNPLAPAPEKDHNDDPDISLHDSVYSLVYLETVRPEYQNVVALQSTDRLTWKRKVLHHQELAGNGGDLILSPAVIWTGGSCRCFFVMGNYESGHRIFATSAPTLEELDFAGASPLDIEGIPTGLLPWHLDVFPDGAGGYVMLLTLVAPDGKRGGKGGRYFLHVARSDNLTDWKLDPAPVLNNCYRSSGFVKDGILYIYFSSNFWGDEWKTGLYKIALGG